MAQTILVKSDLSVEMISAGRQLLHHLDLIGIVFDAAFWLFDDDIAEWRLVMASATVRSNGPNALYHKVNQALSQLNLMNSLSIDMFSIVDERTPVVKLLVGALGTTASVDGTRLDNATIDGVRLSGCLLYRLTINQTVSVGEQRA
ncbi:MAG TPA: hypothetical protein VMU82_17070 [Acetobacteraceae bacterium]|nr:hypothetical protein [Acetobacteraceae bacterium]